MHDRFTYTLSTRYTGPTDTHGSTITVTGLGRTRRYSYDFAAHSPHRAAAERFCQEWRIVLGPYIGDTRSGRGNRYVTRPRHQWRQDDHGAWYCPFCDTDSLGCIDY